MPCHGARVGGMERGLRGSEKGRAWPFRCLAGPLPGTHTTHALSVGGTCVPLGPMAALAREFDGAPLCECARDAAGQHLRYVREQPIRNLLSIPRAYRTFRLEGVARPAVPHAG